jgi:basic membrane protein A
MKRRTLLATGAALAMAAGARRRRAQDDPTKVGFVYVGPIGDGGWTYQHDQGRWPSRRIRRRGRDRLQESVPEGADAERVMTQMALSGCELIFTTSFGYMDATMATWPPVPGREVRARHRLQARRQRLDLFDARFYEGRAVIRATSRAR